MANGGEFPFPRTGVTEIDDFAATMYTRRGLDGLTAHLRETYGISVKRIDGLDLGVFRVERRDGLNWAVRVFGAVRSAQATHADAAVLESLATADFPAERLAAPVSVFEGQSVLATESIEPVARHERREAIRELGGVQALGALAGRLGSVAVDAARVGDGGCWHHLAEGSPSEEIAAARRLLAAAEGMVEAAERAQYEDLCTQFEELDGGEGLPRALVHPDFVMANIVASREREIVAIDWAGAGYAPRVWTLACLLFSQGAKNIRRVDRVLAGYRKHAELEAQELQRLAKIMRVRPLVLHTWEFCLGRRSLASAALGASEVATLADAIAAQALQCL